MDTIRMLNGKMVAVLLVSALASLMVGAAEEVVKLENAFGAAEIELYGANVRSFVPAGGREVLFRATGNTDYEEGQWRNRGVPISWPWFDTFAGKDKPMHGFARSRMWTVFEKSGPRLVLGLESSPETKKIWPYDFRLRYEIELAERLSLKLTTFNTGKVPMKVNAGFHPYFAVSSLRNLGLQGLGETNKTAFAGNHKFLPIKDIAVTISDAGWKRQIAFAAHGTSRAVVWNIGARWAKFPDFSEPDADSYLCIEPQNPYEEDTTIIPPGCSHSVTLCISSSIPAAVPGMIGGTDSDCQKLARTIRTQSIVTNGVEVRWFEEMVPMKDGTRLYTYGALPKEGETVGLVLERSPYVHERRVDMPSYALREQGSIRRGYAFVRQHVRGTGMSEGDWVPYVDERADGLATLAWLRTLPHYRGEIFLHGGSYLSSVHWSYLETNPSDVKGAVLNIQDVNRYNIHYRNGHYKAALHGGWVVGGYKKKNRSLRRDASVKFTDLPLAGFSERRLGEYVADLEETWRHPRPEDAWWRTPGSAGGEYRRALLDSTMPVLMVTGFYDIYTEGLFDMWRELPSARRANCALVVDAGDHGGKSCVDFPNGFRKSAGAVDSIFDWFDFCRGRKDALKVVRPGETRWYELWGGAWRSAPALTDGENALEVPLAFEKTHFTYDPKNPPSFPGSGCLAFGGMKEQAAPGFRPDVLSFVSKPFAAETHVRGRMKLALGVGTDADDTAFYVRVMIGKGGKWYTLRDDIKSISWDTPDYRPGETVTVDYLLSDHSFVIGPGDTIRVDVAGANVSQFIPHTNYRGEFRLQAKSRPAHSFVVPEKCRLTLPTL